MDTLHHAYILFGKGESADSTVSPSCDFFTKITSQITSEYGVSIEKIVFEFEQISVDDVEEISRAMRIIPQTGFARLVIVNARGIGTSAQHALLKTLEEPTSGSYICIVLSHEIPLMPTVVSRVRVVRLNSISKSDNQSQESGEEKVQEFIKSSHVKRLEITKAILADYDKERITKSDVINFLENVIAEYKKNFKSKSASADSKSTIPKTDIKSDPRVESILLVETYMRDTNASLKQCLELLALSL